MAGETVMHVDGIMKPEGLMCSVVESYFKPEGAAKTVINDKKQMEKYEVSEEEEPLMEAMECRICQEEDHINNLESPCGCCGSLKFAHRKCVQRWVNEKGDANCEICNQAYQPGYVSENPRPRRARPQIPTPRSEDTAIDIRDGWTFTHGSLNSHDTRLLTLEEAEREALEAEYEEYAAVNSNGSAFCRAAVLILMALLLFRHALTIPGADSDDDVLTVFALFFLRAIGFIVPCYILGWAITILQNRDQREDTTAVAEVAILLQSDGGGAGLQLTIAPGPNTATTTTTTTTTTAAFATTDTDSNTDSAAASADTATIAIHQDLADDMTCNG